MGEREIVTLFLVKRNAPMNKVIFYALFLFLLGSYSSEPDEAVGNQKVIRPTVGQQEAELVLLPTKDISSIYRSCDPSDPRQPEFKLVQSDGVYSGHFTFKSNGEVNSLMGPIYELGNIKFDGRKLSFETCDEIGD